MNSTDVSIRPACGVSRGAIVALRLFDVAYEIDLPAIERVGEQGGGPRALRSHLSTTPAKAISFGVAPLLLSLPPIRLPLRSGTAEVDVSARCYDFGVIALALRLPLQDRSWPEFIAAMSEMEQAVGPAAPMQLWNALLDPLRAQLGAALLRPSRSTMDEDYLIATVQRWDRPMSATTVLEQVDLIPVLSGDTRPLSPQMRSELLSQQFSYYEDDLVVLTWDRAFIYEPRPDTDVADVLEVANAQLLEQRYYDELLGRELPRIYDLVESYRRALYVFAPRRCAQLARQLHMRVAEVTELTDKVDNALQVSEDVYLARVYAATLETLRVPKIGAAVDQKLGIIRDTYTALYDEASSTRGELMELTIILLIVLEIVLAFVQ